MLLLRCDSASPGLQSVDDWPDATPRHRFVGSPPMNVAKSSEAIVLDELEVDPRCVSPTISPSSFKIGPPLLPLALSRFITSSGTRWDRNASVTCPWFRLSAFPSD
jgi:hypothetical protein